MERSAKIMIEANGLSKFYGDFVAIQDISFSIPEGQIVAFLGPNGAGKSTTMKVLTGFLSPNRGRAEIAGLDIQRRRIEASRKLGYLPENGPLYQDMTPLELLTFFGEARGLVKSELEKAIDRVNHLCALGEAMEKPISKLSRGYRQRVGLAQALLHDPEVLIMDEPYRRTRSQPDSNFSGQHSGAGPDQDDPHFDPHSAGGGCGGRSGASDQ